MITRPYHLGIRSQNKISKLGKKSFITPLIKIKYLDIKISDSNYDYIVVTSQNAVATFRNNLWMKEKYILVVGGKTKDLLLQENCKKILICEENVSDLINNMYTKFSSVSNILYICGDHLSYDLEGSLKSNSYNITSKVVYTSDAITELSKNEITQINEVVEIVMFYSPRTAMIFADLALKYNLSTSNKIAICISNKCANNIVKLQWMEVKVASSPNEIKMLELI
ncbi:uroporphyrinogen-III synthase [Candidatus Bandiella numerosa]|uniref:uroporphyrinogen-III synthase n=1 Tax=Candidatus Bandiella numerosa TaxID=2570586 RepID=UPI001F3D1E50|nr:uroporphyrinogen-III synthase [Candidatus Bandiella numerosa]